MKAFQFLLSLFLVSILAYTAVVINNHGWNLLPVFFGDILKMNWPGQFNFDFMSMLLLSGVWTAWRNHFSWKGLGLAILAIFGGILFLSIYLLVLTKQAIGDIHEVLLGKQRSKQFNS